MTLTDPRDALADQSDFIGYLVGLAGLADVVHTLAGDGPRAAADPRAPDDFVHLLLGVASVGAGIARLADSTVAQSFPAAGMASTARWLR
ncbi:hypothetical protein [Mycobacterium avium]|uniref:Uncharacterized protein n=1 Tax=Mycolicibacterium paratuberculosis (strain ATCC BAA-968 / K-10) TaxID=262316 RepID=Q73T72_MYCPA|nr:hypothetical protein [Mycobacterium avium]ELP44530.1 hypothetical protein D522_21968 [Mycobacterium avium subsp. paratuberculosis S5]ETA96704.1 hypothetical protein O979_21425 [Mycobacterium avium subsp. paratuberculosis 10-4404]ETA99428.1 hypothetical protein O978_21455 [Mycobacterium avium subsp. paratuberculosis 10-5864]ETB08946.1 hypothetical protein O980_21095 [Mycobacterium avium subsp. paratuberculosis 08-8281]ETB26836.1 hypothetical protein O977_22945 [Mycobacterium avium subsp. par